MHHSVPHRSHDKATLEWWGIWSPNNDNNSHSYDNGDSDDNCLCSFMYHFPIEVIEYEHESSNPLYIYIHILSPLPGALVQIYQDILSFSSWLNIIWYDMMWVMNMGNILSGAGFKPAVVAIPELACWPLRYLGSLMQSPYPSVPVKVAPCFRGQCRLLRLSSI